MSIITRWFPWLVILACGGWIVQKSLLPHDNPSDMHIREFGRLPMVYQGRVKPFDTLARTSLTIISNRQSFVDENKKNQPAIRWLLDVISHTETALKYKVFRIDHPQLLNMLRLEPREGYLYAIDEFKASLPKLDSQIDRVQRMEPRERDDYDTKLLEFHKKVLLFRCLAEAHSGFQAKTQEELTEELETYRLLRTHNPLPHSIPPRSASQQWKTFKEAAIESLTGEPDPSILALGRMFNAYDRNEVDAFNQELEKYRKDLTQLNVPDTHALDFEVHFNHLEPFYHCAVLYVVAFLLSCLAWLAWSAPLNRAALGILVLTSVVHTFGLAARVYISGYPPITNLYGTAIFIGWGCVVLGIVLEFIYRLGVGTVTAAIAGFLTLLIAHNLAGDGDTLEMLQAVLDTKFWLATHVVIINLGYTATLFAGFLSILFILRGVLTSSLSRDAESILARMIYGIVCFALFMSFVGTVLGGLWADDSWGRFWGWDPKENGALIIVLWNALSLHARWAGMVRDRGIAVLAVFGNIVTAWSWWGVNQLGVGLHSYGFINSIAFWLVIFVGSQLAIMGLGLLPRKIWRSSSMNA